MTAIARLGYLGFEVSDLAAWKRFAVDVLGLEVANAADDDSTLALRIDDQAQRIVLHRGSSDDLAYAGFEMDDEPSLDRLVDRLSQAGVAVTRADAAQARARRVGRVFQLQDPRGVPIELFCAPDRAAEPFHSPLVSSGFVTGGEGLGHIVLSAVDAAETERFYCALLGMRLSDHVEVELAPGFSLRLTFLHVNSRHHTVAFAVAPMPKRMHHFMLEVGALEDVGLAYDRCVDAGIEIANTLGMHPNDRMVSFYARTPSGFEVEIGWGGRKIDDATWEPRTYHRASIWGHRPPTGVP